MIAAHVHDRASASGISVDHHRELVFAVVEVTARLRAPVRVVYEAGSPGGCSGGAGSCDPIQISVHVGARHAGCSPDGVGG